MRQLLLLVFASMVAGASLADAFTVVDDTQLSLGGIAIDDTRSAVLRKLGQPCRVTETGDFLSIRMDYPGISVWLGEGGRVGEVLSKSSSHCTPAGLCPGSPFNEANVPYGPPAIVHREDGPYLEYPSSESSCWLQVIVSRGIIESVRAECQP